MPLLQVLIAISVLLGVAGWVYAILIRYHPIDRTWIEVAIGVGGTLVGLMFANYFVLLYYGLVSQLWWTLPIPLAAFAITGHSQAIMQEVKRRDQERKAAELNRFKELD